MIIATPFEVAAPAESPWRAVPLVAGLLLVWASVNHISEGRWLGNENKGKLQYYAHQLSHVAGSWVSPLTRDQMRVCLVGPPTRFVLNDWSGPYLPDRTVLTSQAAHVILLIADQGPGSRLALIDRGGRINPAVDQTVARCTASGKPIPTAPGVLADLRHETDE